MSLTTIAPTYITYVNDEHASTSYHGQDYCIIGCTKKTQESAHSYVWYDRYAIIFYKLPRDIKYRNVSSMSVLFPFASSTSNDDNQTTVAQYSIVTADQVPTGSLTWNNANTKKWTYQRTSKYTAYAGSEVIDSTSKTITYNLAVDTVKPSDAASDAQDGVSAIQLITDTEMDLHTDYYLRVTLFGTKSYRYYKSTSKSNIVLNINWSWPNDKVEITYPKNNISVNSAAESILSWSYTCEPSTFGLVQNPATYRIIWGGSGQTGQFSGGGGAQYCAVPANTFPVGEVSWSLCQITDFGGAVYDSATFIAAGATGAPTISSVTTNTAKPVVTWTVSSQDCYQVQFYQDDELLHDSGLVSGSSVRTYTYPGVLPNGTYYVKVRVINTYGYYTDYTSRAFILSYTEPTAPEYVNAPVNADYAVEISGDIPTGTTVTVLRTDEDGSNAVNLGSFSGTPIKDYSGELNKAYHYSLMALDSNNKLAVSESATARIKADGCIIHDTRDYTNYYHINITDDEMFDITRADSQSKTFAQVIGRRYPIKEQMDYIISTRQFTCFVYDDDYNGLMDLMLSGTSVYFRTTGEAFYADLTVSDRGSYVSGGRLVTIQLTRLSE